MKVYFAITKSMLREYGEQLPNTTDIRWQLSDDSILYFVLASSKGQILDRVGEYMGKTPKEEWCICEAEMSKEDAVECCRAAIVGDSMRPFVIIKDMLWMSKNETNKK